ncbi:hypothetical protein LOTGIDRAFT_161910 [Lottia gigantea]|uniref:Uncharacterized protein n=1 Tax=Lottia gigantea TaxID=225164 RepID=V4AE18_LOTGI|nr:hypothetical protein LOTGIDRAFT_161910 [Lottia gigantea]ESO93345.1 hypothetical protein LOTGIDRAFT_161910 [Lottia gigantea]
MAESSRCLYSVNPDWSMASVPVREPVRVFIFGTSYVKRLHKFLEKVNSPNLGLNHGLCYIRIHGMPKITHNRDVSEEDVGLIPTTAEDRLTNILIDKLIKRRLVLPSASGADANTTVSGPSSSTLNSPLPSVAAIPTTSVVATIPITTLQIPPAC